MNVIGNYRSLSQLGIDVCRHNSAKKLVCGVDHTRVGDAEALDSCWDVVREGVRCGGVGSSPRRLHCREARREGERKLRLAGAPHAAVIQDREHIIVMVEVVVNCARGMRT